MRMQFLAKYREMGLLIMRVSLGVLFVILTSVSFGGDEISKERRLLLRF